jgi:hypothetical protein
MTAKLTGCERCKRIEQWFDHIGFKPNKMQRYEKLLEFVKSVAWIDRYTDKEIQEFNDIGYYIEAVEARKLLEEIGEL